MHRSFALARELRPPAAAAVAAGATRGSPEGPLHEATGIRLGASGQISRGGCGEPARSLRAKIWKQTPRGSSAQPGRSSRVED